MQKLGVLVVFGLMTTGAFAQAPTALPYSAVPASGSCTATCLEQSQICYNSCAPEDADCQAFCDASFYECWCGCYPPYCN